MKSKIYETVINFIKKHKLIQENSKLIIALSGGPDSIFALHFFYQFKNKYKIELIAAHVNHNLRNEDSDKDQFFCEKLCRKLEIPLFIKSADVKTFSEQNKFSIEESARIIRYNFFDEIKSSEKADAIITAHNSDDNSETILLNLIKGTGIGGLVGIPIQREKIVRPFLCLSKNEIVDFLKFSKFKYRVDKSNLANDFERNKIRNKIIPLIYELNPSFNKTMRNFSDNIISINLLLQTEIEKSFKKLIRIEDEEIEIDLDLFASKNISIASLVLKKLFEENLKIGFTSNDSEEMKKLSAMQKGATTKLRKDFIAIKEEKFLGITKKVLEKFSEIEIKLNQKKSLDDVEISLEEITSNDDLSKFAEIISGDKINDIFILRSWKSGDKFIPLGMKSFKKLSDFLTDAKVKSKNKKKQLVLINRNNIAYVLGLRIDERYKVTDSTKKKIGICIKKTCKK